MSQAPIRTYRTVDAGSELPSHRLLLRTGMVRQVASGIYSLGPLAQRVLRRIEAIARDEMEAIGCQEVALPVVQPAALWRESGRYETVDAALARFQDRNGQRLVLAMTHEEAATDLVRAQVDSYRQLPLALYQIQTKFRDEPRPRGGLVRLREFTMKDAYSFHTSEEDLNRFYDAMVEAYRRFFRRCGLEVKVVESDTGIMSGQTAHEFMVPAPGGEDTLLLCPTCGYAANQEVAASETAGPAPQATAPESPSPAELEPVQEHHTPDTPTIEALAARMGCTPRETLKTVFYTAGDRLVLAVIRGDLEVNDVKLRRLLQVPEIRSLSADEAREAGLAVGYASPVGLRLNQPFTVVADTSVIHARNLVTGANRADYHLSGVNYGRDFTADYVGDISVAAAGHRCVHCGGTLTAVRGIEAGNTFKLGTRYSEAMGATFTDAEGKTHPMVMGSYGIGITRMLAAIIEQNHDENGIIWPASVAPYPVHLLVAGKDPEAQAVAEEVYQRLGPDQVLYDDRNLGAGAKFTDADLLGMPVRITISRRSLATGGAEVKSRRSGEVRVVSLAELPAAVESLLAPKS